MSDVVAMLDDWGKPAWIGLMVLGFIIFWPIGLLVLAYLIWSGRMSCGRPENLDRWQQRMTDRWEQHRGRWGRHMGRCGMHGSRRGDFPPTGNRAFDEYRAETLRRLEEEATEFQEFLSRLRMAKDKAEFDEFMTERRNRPSTPDQSGPASPSPEPSA
jgi:hypothetical protein